MNFWEFVDKYSDEIFFLVVMGIAAAAAAFGN